MPEKKRFSKRRLLWRITPVAMVPPKRSALSELISSQQQRGRKFDDCFIRRCCLAHDQPELRQFVTVPANLKEILRAFTIRGHWTNGVGAGNNSLPAKFKRRVEPDAHAVMFGDQSAVGFDSPRTAAQRDHPSVVILQGVAQRPRFDVTKRNFSILFDNLSGRAALALGYERIEIH